MTEPLELGIREALDRGDLREAATLGLEGYGPGLQAFLASVLRSDSDGREAFSMLAEELWTSLPGFRGDGSFRAWAYRLAWRAALHWRADPYRRRGRRLATSEISGLAAAVSSQAPARAERARAVEALREALEPEEQALLTLRLDRELSWEEIQAVLEGDGRTSELPALRKRFQRLKEKLGRLARERGLTQA